MHLSSLALRFSLASPLALALTGCMGGTMGTHSIPAPAPDAGVAIQGRVHGGQQPITGAHVYLFAANTTGYGGPGIAASASNQSVSLLNATGHSDAIGGYVQTGGDGSFSITGDYSCTPNTQVYLYALGGNPGLANGTNNTAAGLLAALGNCPTAGNFVAATPYVVINEVSTVATAYAFAGFASDATHVSSSGTALAQTGIANAFANVANLETLSTGVALATTPAGNGTVPRTTIDTLANILAACVNTDGSMTSGSPCNTLLTTALAGGTTGAQPTDTAGAAINIAHNPAANIAALYGLPTPTAPFGPALSAQPNDFTLGVSYGGPFFDALAVAVDGSGNVWISDVANSTGESAISELYASSHTGAGGSSSWSSNSPISGGGAEGSELKSLSIDPSGNVWAGPSSGGGLVELSPDGSPISPSTGYTDGTYTPLDVASDGSGNIWSGNGSALYEYIPGTGFANTSGFPGGGVYFPGGLAVDASGNIWLGNRNGTLSVFNSSGDPIRGSPIFGFNAGDSKGTYGYGTEVAVDGTGNIWVASYSALAEFNSSGGAVSGSNGYTGGGLNFVNGIAIDSAGNVWAANWSGGSISEFSSSGMAISPSAGYIPVSPFAGVNQVAIDSSGNVWATNFGSGTLVEVVGASSPVVTPISANLRAPYGAHAVNLP